MKNRTIRALALASVACAAALSTTTDASALAGAVTTCSTTADGFPVCVGTTEAGGGSGPSSFIAAFPLSTGGWTEVYSDDSGVWWIDHNPNGSVTIGEEKTGGGAQKKAGPSTPNVPGTYTKQTRMIGSGTPVSAIKPNVAALKAVAAQQTATFGGMSTSTQKIAYNAPSGARHVGVVVRGSGTCHAITVVTRDGKFVSSKGIEKRTFPSMQYVDLPNVPGKYRIDVKGNSGCMPSKASAYVTVAPLWGF
jgi:hypothetical protein